jgi:ketosteroid isomerase-like protein
MKTRWVISLMVLGAFILMPQAAIADDLADLKAAGEKVFQVWNTADVEGIFALWPEDGGIWFPASGAFPVPVRKSPQGAQFWSKWFQTHIIRIRWYNPQYRVIGNTGLVWGHMSHLVMNKNSGTGKEEYRKAAGTFVKSEGKWKLVLWMDAPIPSEKELY